MPRAGARGDDSRIAIVDIGSNSIRLVVFDGLRRTPMPVYNEKVLCGLGRSIGATGRLDAEGIARAHENLPRFAALAREMGVGRIDAVATAAVREATDGADFAAEVERRCGLEIRVLSAAEEARGSALGVLSGIPEADGIMGDLGGGSLEIVELENGGLGAWATLPLGPLRLMSQNRNDARGARRAVKTAIDGLEWLARGRRRAVYPVGGAWRALARIHMRQTGYPLHVIDHYTVAPGKLDAILAIVMRQTPASMAPVPGVSAPRLETLPLAAKVLRRLLRVVRPARVVFSAQGLREGLLYARLSERVRREDPLLAACRDMARGLSRFEVLGDEIMAWTDPLFAGEEAPARRLREAACLIADIGWTEHPDYRAEHAFYKTYRLAGVGVDHAGRAFLALTLAKRYGGGVHRKVLAGARGLLDEATAERARILGLALRLAIDISGGLSGVLTRTALRLDRTTVTLVLSPGAEVFTGDVVQRRLDALAAALDRAPAVVRSDSVPHVAPRGSAGFSKNLAEN